MTPNKVIVDLSGYMFSGKTALSDLLREFDSLSVPHYHQEFDLIRVPNGLGDLLATIESRSQIRINYAINKYQSLIKSQLYPPGNLSKFWRYGGFLDLVYPGIEEKTKMFVDSITTFEWEQRTPFMISEINPFNIMINKITSKLSGEIAWPKVKTRLIDCDIFYPNVQAYLLSIINPNDENVAHIIHNGLEPYRPSTYFKLFTDIKCIIVDRDIRDIFMTSVLYSKGFNNNVKTYKNISGAHDAKIFIEKQKKMRNFKDNFPNILRINFEDLVFNYENTIKTIINFLSINLSDHKNKLKFFNPDLSKKNTRMWINQSEYRSQIKLIEKELPDLCKL
jgi:hypothetical protein